jgi:glycosyltransferase involved in cell wall biosynthesis
VTADDSEPCELSILLPCLDEAETVEICVRKAVGWMRDRGVVGEVIVADNGSTDGSQVLATAAGARVVDVPRRGYGAALQGGITAARGRYVIMGDADDSYDLDRLDPFLERLRAGDDVVMGNRFAGGIEPDAMPFLHRYLGNPVLSRLGRIMFNVPVQDFHCGLRGMNTESVRALKLRTTGMEFASEMVMKAALHRLRISEVPTRLRPDGRSRAPHLRTWHDGWRHLRFLLLYSPRWLFLLPGLIAFAAGLVVTSVLVVQGMVHIGAVGFGVGTLVYAAAVTAIGFQAAVFALFTKIYAVSRGFLPPDKRLDRFGTWFTLERGLLLGCLVFVAGALAAVLSLWRWRSEGFGQLDPTRQLRVVVPAALGLLLGSATVLSSLFLSILGMDKDNHLEYPVTTASVSRSSPPPAGRPADVRRGTEGVVRTGRLGARSRTGLAQPSSISRHRSLPQKPPTAPADALTLRERKAAPHSMT